MVTISQSTSGIILNQVHATSLLLTPLLLKPVPAETSQQGHVMMKKNWLHKSPSISPLKLTWSNMIIDNNHNGSSRLDMCDWLDTRQMASMCFFACPRSSDRFSCCQLRVRDAFVEKGSKKVSTYTWWYLYHCLDRGTVFSYISE